MNVMFLEISESAATRMKGIMAGQANYSFHLIYDTEGCGCAVNGVPTLKWLPNNHDPAHTYITLCEQPVPVRITEKDALFFEEKLRLDFSPETFCYRLSGPGQIYHGCLNVI
jgi:uncharacterized protein YqkB